MASLNEKMWCYFIQLGDNMWGDDGSHAGTDQAWHNTLACDCGTFRKIVDFLPSCGINTLVIDVGDGIQYESHPELNIPGGWDKQTLKTELDHVRSLGITPVPKLNFSACHDAWMKIHSRMVSTPRYYKVCEDTIKEVYEAFGCPPYFHLGLDEENEANQRQYLYAVMRQHELWWHDAYFLFGICDKLGTRPWIWSDYYWDHSKEFIAKMPKSVLQSNWFYSRVKRDADGAVVQPQYKAYFELDKAGFDQIPTSSTWETWLNSYETMELCRDMPTVKGFMTAPWLYVEPRHIYGLMNDAYLFCDARIQTFGK